MTGIHDNEVIALPHEPLREGLRKYNRLAKTFGWFGGAKAPPAHRLGGITRRG
jgi:hypothetical protein